MALKALFLRIPCVCELLNTQEVKEAKLYPRQTASLGLERREEGVQLKDMGSLASRYKNLHRNKRLDLESRGGYVEGLSG